MENFLSWLRESRSLLGVIGILVAFWLGYNTVEITLKNYELAQQIDQLEDEIAVLELENANYQFLINYYNTDSFIELEARDKLGVVASGEKVLVLPDDRYENLEIEQPEETESSGVRANWSAWAEFLFGIGG